jgi:hypothetical protein
MEQIGLFLVLLSGVSEGVMDKIQFHFSKSIFSNFKNHLFWNPALSWRNKWKNGSPIYGERFKFSSTLFVGVTDAWHMFKTLKNILLFLGLLIISIKGVNLVILFILARILYGVGFYGLYNLTNKKR